MKYRDQEIRSIYPKRIKNGNLETERTELSSVLHAPIRKSKLGLNNDHYV